MQERRKMKTNCVQLKNQDANFYDYRKHYIKLINAKRAVYTEVVMPEHAVRCVQKKPITKNMNTFGNTTSTHIRHHISNRTTVTNMENDVTGYSVKKRAIE